MRSTSEWDSAVKRGLDVIGAASLLILTGPLIAATAIAVLIVHGRPITFCQQRPGLDERTFLLRKFRTMRPADEAAGLVTDAQRVTPFGKWLRASSLDELPSLLNVLKGDMSFVGPRPLLVQYLGRYTEHQRKRHKVRPGITGLAQVSGRNGLSWERRLELDVHYVQTRNLKLDFQILIQTVRVVLSRQGVTDDNGVSMSEFRAPETTE